MIVQIYEVQKPDEAELMIDLDVDHIGSVLLSENNWKNNGVKDSIRLIASSPSRSSLIPLFHSFDAISRALDFYQPDIVHFCEALTENNGKNADFSRSVALQEAVRMRFPEIAVMRSIPIAPPGLSERVPTLELAREFEPLSDYFLTDTLLIRGSDSAEIDQPVSGFVGITGTLCDWDMAARLVRQSRIPVILAGGLSPENVYDGIVAVRPAGVDSCTCTNVLDAHGKPIRFKKDLEKVRRFVEMANRAER